MNSAKNILTIICNGIYLPKVRIGNLYSISSSELMKSMCVEDQTGVLVAVPSGMFCTKSNKPCIEQSDINRGYCIIEDIINTNGFDYTEFISVPADTQDIFDKICEKFNISRCPKWIIVEYTILGSSTSGILIDDNIQFNRIMEIRRNIKPLSIKKLNTIIEKK